jgi:hypothetical protein
MHPDHWLFRYFVMLDSLVGFDTPRHLLVMWIFLAFIPIHVYLAIGPITSSAKEGFVGLSGGRWCRKGTKFEDGQQFPSRKMMVDQRPPEERLA